MLERTFVYSKTFNNGFQLNIKQILTFPLKESVDEYYHQIVFTHNVPLFAHDDLYSKWQEFVRQENDIRLHNNYTIAANELMNRSIDIHKLCSKFDEAYKKHVPSYHTTTHATDEEVFGQAYNSQVHSDFAQNLLKAERLYASTISKEVEKRDAVLQQLDEELVVSTKLGLEKEDVDISDFITTLQESHCRHRDLIECEFNNRIRELKRVQRQNFRHSVFNGLFDVRKNNSLDPDLELSAQQEMYPPATTKTKYGSFPSPWSESFTVQLGRQLRTTFNFRLIRDDPLTTLHQIDRDEANLDAHNDGYSASHSVKDDETDIAERLSNAMGIYSNDLNGLILLVDTRLNTYRGNNRRLAEACEKSTEFHFPDLFVQLEQIQETVNRIGPRPSMQINTLSNSDGTDSDAPLEPIHGDVYITRHSNLFGKIGGLDGGGGGITVVFHLVVDESQQEDRIRIGSPLHCALSVILRVCFDYNITTLSMPVFLVDPLNSAMNKQWRARRAETVFKVLKGALMELSTWRGSALRSLQFLAPPTLDDNELASIGRIITSSFIQPTPFSF